MTAVLTLMVRDEADIIAAMLEHHLAHGIDRILVTDNGSVDGTREILDAYARVAPVTVFDDLEHRKQQSEVVTRMARLAAAEHGADWVINADADEFLRPVDPELTLGQVFAALPRAVGSFRVPVTNLVGPLARHGSGIRRLVHRDVRSDEQLRAAGLIAHPTRNAIHVGDPDVEVSQGNHAVSIPAGAEPDDALALEVLHLPWRSMEQIERKTRNMGEGYDASPALRPSPRHHGMRDWRRMRAGLLTSFIAARMPLPGELDGPGFERDTSLRDALDALDALLPELHTASLDDSADAPFDDDAILEMRVQARAAEALERLALDELTNARLDADALREDRDRIGVQLEGTSGHAERLERELEAARLESANLRLELDALRRSGAQRVADAARRAMGRVSRG
ncbi:Glycosyl transferase family 2 [Agrococcus baldri]|uniref:Glycosyl transferase family 2 n=1 Tax=Agrococcus baldri TaxID=153730 RepID=A0AA94HN24_9MICO|nr:glycosyltransferase family 2 protein [Agrococcus baldri]SFS14128.1 Glycosyl transferase family 2 [Agrococcus baldri]